MACVLMVLLLCRCGAPQSVDHPVDADDAAEPVEVPGIEVHEINVTLSLPPARSYGGLVEHALLPAETLVVETFTRAGLVHDPRLSKAARELARTAPESLNIPGSLVDGVLDWAGLVNPRPRLSVVEFSDPDGRCTVSQGEGVSAECTSALQSAVEEAFASPLPRSVLKVGVGIVRLDALRGRIIVAITEQTVEIAAIPASADIGTRVPFRGRLLSGRSSPHLELVDAGGQGHQIPVATGEGGAFAAEIGCAHGAGAYQVELLAEGPHGVEIVANFGFHCGEEPPQSVRVTIENLASDVSITDIERANFQALNQARRRYGLPPLEWDDAVRVVARAHSEDMRQSGFVGHRSPTTGLPGDRFRSAGIKGAVIRENIARGYGPNGIHEGLMSSPGHRANILSEDVTRVGIGAVYGASESTSSEARRPIFLTQNFFIPRGADIPDVPAEALRERVDASREGAGLTALRWDRELSRLAQTLADGVAEERSSVARRQYQAGLDESSFQTAETQQVIASSFNALTELDAWRSAYDGVIGIGVARITEGAHRDSVVLIIAVGGR